MIQIFKSNKSVTGHAASFSINSKEGSLYIQLIKQTGYNAEKHLGSFKGGDKLNVKFNIWEVGSILDALLKNTTYKTVHKSTDRTTSVSVGPYFAQDDAKKILGYSFSFSYKDGEEQKRFSISLNSGEKVVIMEYLRFMLGRAFNASYNEQKKQFEKKNKTDNKNEVKEEEPAILTNEKDDIF
jgi:hypothetical protein